MLTKAIWIKSPAHTECSCHEFYRDIKTEKQIERATLCASAIGMYTAFINGKRVGNDLFTPGWTEYRKRVQYQTYDVTGLLASENELSFKCAEGWAVGYIGYHSTNHAFMDHVSLIFSLEIEYTDGSKELFTSDESVRVRSSKITFTQIYDGETVDGTAQITEYGNAVADEVDTALVPQINETVKEQERIYPVKYFVTPKGERVIDFGQNLAGYVQIKARGSAGERIVVTHAEVLDAEGNFYTENLRAAKQKNTYVLSGEGEEVFKPSFTWQGFRYMRLDEYPEAVDLNDFTAIVVHSDIKRTGDFSCGHEKINQLYHNVIWGQKGNYVDVPTDCPQRDERLGWTGDALAFVRTAAINYDVEAFFKKWLGDLALTQGPDGGVPGIIPSPIFTYTSAAWGDAAVVCPWEVYLAYGNTEILEAQFESMRAWVEYMHGFGEEEFLWIGGTHYGDWLNMDGGKGYDIDFAANDYIASAFFAYSTSLLIKAGKVLDKDMSEYEALHTNVVNAIRSRFFRDGVPALRTQTAYALAVRFDLCEDGEKCAKILAELVEENGRLLTTGFVGTPQLLHALSQTGRNDLAYDLLLAERFPSWLFSVNLGATTMWEHWDGIKEDGSFWGANMNSFNHYAYGAVYDWIFGVAAGIKPCEDGAGYTHITLAPVPDRRLGFLRAGINSRAGRIESHWYYKGDEIYFEFTVPEMTVADITLPDGRRESVSGGKYIYTVTEK